MADFGRFWPILADFGRFWPILAAPSPPGWFMGDPGMSRCVPRCFPACEPKNPQNMDKNPLFIDDFPFWPFWPYLGGQNQLSHFLFDIGRDYT